MDAETMSHEITRIQADCPRCKALEAEVDRLWEFVEWCSIPATEPLTANVAIRAMALLCERQDGPLTREPKDERKAGGDK